MIHLRNLVFLSFEVRHPRLVFARGVDPLSSASRISSPSPSHQTVQSRQTSRTPPFCSPAPVSPACAGAGNTNTYII
ncbi:hypothetical protein BV22DRAFT_754131 [Leucogyrophana mollusca]|uniref:Uncharacterized protein n=1 Tax=Leucogyrophana mollusca TaxID=85980 RepID=A0ACB8B765_9AGAM|nr:hypothetical protein BV22DRAFT_754131 [Leucogyrophana mollusca]